MDPVLPEELEQQVGHGHRRERDGERAASEPKCAPAKSAIPRSA